MIIFRDHNILFLRAPKTGSASLAQAAILAGGEPGIPTHQPLDEIAHYHGLDVSDMDVVVVGRRPEERAMSLCRWCRQRSGDWRFCHPNTAIQSGLLFDYCRGRWGEHYACAVSSYFTNQRLQPRSLHVFRLEDQLGELEEWVASRIGREFRVPHENRSTASLAVDRLVPKTVDELFRVWGWQEWSLFGYDIPGVD